MSPLNNPWTSNGGHGGALRSYFSRSTLRYTRVALGTWCVVFAAISGLVLTTSAGPTNNINRALVLAIGVSAVATGIVWIVGSWPPNKVSILFMVYADSSVAFVFLSMVEPAVLFPGATMLAVIGSYIPIFHGLGAFLGHQLFSTSVTIILFVHVLHASYTTLSVTVIYLLSSLLLQVTVPLLTFGLFSMLCHETASAHFDPLTGLRNRRGLSAELGCDQAGTPFDCHVKFVVLVLDLDKFKTVNDRFGHEYGDRVLKSVAEQIHTVFGTDAISCRTGGEEFVIVLKDSEQSALHKVRAMSAAILSDGGPSVSAGMAAHACTPFCTHEENLFLVYADLHRDADAAMYRAKQLGGDTVVIHIGQQD